MFFIPMCVRMIKTPCSRVRINRNHLPFYFFILRFLPVVEAAFGLVFTLKYLHEYLQNEKNPFAIIYYICIDLFK
jgi:hypothetical protein